MYSTCTRGVNPFINMYKEDLKTFSKNKGRFHLTKVFFISFAKCKFPNVIG